MAEKQAEQEPTMEEILASIRRIISEDEEPAGEEAAAEEAAPAEVEAAGDPEPEPEPDPEPVAEVESEEDVLELTERVDEEPLELPRVDALEEDGDLVIFEAEDEVAREPEPVVEAPEPVAPSPEPAPKPEPEPAPVALNDVDEMADLVSEPVAAAATSAFGSLISNMVIAQRPGEGLTLEALVRELLKPMLKEWLDDNLATIVEAKVADEVARLAGRARR